MGRLHASRTVIFDDRVRTRELRSVVGAVVAHTLHELDEVLIDVLVRGVLVQHLHGLGAHGAVRKRAREHEQRLLDRDVAPLVHCAHRELDVLQGS